MLRYMVNHNIASYIRYSRTGPTSISCITASLRPSPSLSLSIIIGSSTTIPGIATIIGISSGAIVAIAIATRLPDCLAARCRGCPAA